MPAYVYFLVASATILWFVPFIFARTKRRAALELDRRARWGMALECLAYSLLWQSSFWERRPEWWRVAVSVALFALACVISWTGARALGRQYRFDAALNARHELVRSGPYRFVRHPIYTSMLCVLLATGVLVAPTYLLLVAVALFLAGTEIRMRVEDQLLESQFGPQFRDYQRSVPRFIPLLK